MTSTSTSTGIGTGTGVTSTADRTDDVDPWERWSWVMAAIWLVFLGFPLVAVLDSDLPVALRGVGVAALLLFVAVYLRGFQTMESWAEPSVHTVRYLGGLALITLGLTVLVGPSGLGTLPFLVSFAMFGLSLRAGVACAGLALAVVGLVPWALGQSDEVWPIAPITALVAVSTGLVRALTDRQVAHRELADETALVAERERVARDVHDVLGHSLTVVSAKAELAERLVDLDPARAKDELAQIQSLTREALAEIRATVAGLRIARLGDELTAARSVLADAGIEAEVPDDPSVVDPRHRLVLAWVLREAVTNVVRHSHAQRCEVVLGRTSLRVEDDGVGLGGPGGAGNGLRGITERVRLAGGALEVGAGPDGRGTRLEVTWP